MTSRRTFVQQVAGGAVLAATVRGLLPRASQGVRGGAGGNSGNGAAAFDNTALLAPVVSFHLDQPYLDLTGRAIPYLPPAGLRSGQPLAQLSEFALRSAHPYI